MRWARSTRHEADGIRSRCRQFLDDARADCRDDRSQRRAELAVDAPAAGESRRERGAETVKRCERPATEAATGTSIATRYLARIDGIVFGDNPEEGVVRGNLFLHAPLRFALEFPDGWEITNSDEQVVAQEPGNKVFMVMRTIEARRGALARAGGAAAHARIGLQERPTSRQTTIDGLTGCRRHLRREGVGRRHGDGAGRALRRETATPISSAGLLRRTCIPRVSGDFDQTIQSFRQMSRDEADAIEPNIIDFYTARGRRHLAVDRAACRQGAGQRLDTGDHEQPRHRQCRRCPAAGSRSWSSDPDDHSLERLVGDN